MKKLIVLLFFYSAIAVSGQWPIITSMTTVKTGSTTWDYYFDQKLMDIGSSVDVYMPGQYVKLAHRHNPYNEDVVRAVGPMVLTDSKTTIGETGVRVYNEGGRDIKYIYHQGEDGTGSECVAYIVDKTKGNDGPWSAVYVPGGCLIVPPADEWCKITTPTITLEHGTISLKNAEGSIASDTLGVQCTADTSVTFNLITMDNYIYLDEGKSEITVNKKPLNTPMLMKKGDSQLSIEDLLTGITKEGFHTGSSVLVMMPE